MKPFLFLAALSLATVSAYAQVDLNSNRPAPQVKGIVQPVNGGTGVDTSATSGCPKVTNGTWTVGSGNCGAAVTASGGLTTTTVGGATNVQPDSTHIIPTTTGSATTYLNGAGQYTTPSGGGGSTSPGGTPLSLQYNQNSDTFGGMNVLTDSVSHTSLLGIGRETRTYSPTATSGNVTTPYVPQDVTTYSPTVSATQLLGVGSIIGATVQQNNYVNLIGPSYAPGSTYSGIGASTGGSLFEQVNCNMNGQCINKTLNQYNYGNADAHQLVLNNYCDSDNILNAEDCGNIFLFDGDTNQYIVQAFNITPNGLSLTDHIDTLAPYKIIADQSKVTALATTGRGTVSGVPYPVVQTTSTSLGTSTFVQSSGPVLTASGSALPAPNTVVTINTSPTSSMFQSAIPAGAVGPFCAMNPPGSFDSEFEIFNATRTDATHLTVPQFQRPHASGFAIAYGGPCAKALEYAYATSINGRYQLIPVLGSPDGSSLIEDDVAGVPYLSVSPSNMTANLYPAAQVMSWSYATDAQGNNTIANPLKTSALDANWAQSDSVIIGHGQYPKHGGIWVTVAGGYSPLAYGLHVEFQQSSPLVSAVDIVGHQQATGTYANAAFKSSCTAWPCFNYSAQLTLGAQVGLNFTDLPLDDAEHTLMTTNGGGAYGVSAHPGTGNVTVDLNAVSLYVGGTVNPTFYADGLAKKFNAPNLDATFKSLTLTPGSEVTAGDYLVSVAAGPSDFNTPAKFGAILAQPQNVTAAAVYVGVSNVFNNKTLVPAGQFWGPGVVEPADGSTCGGTMTLTSGGGPQGFWFFYQGGGMGYCDGSTFHKYF